MAKSLKKSDGQSSATVTDAPPTHISVDPLHLLLDPFNPRLPPAEKGKTQQRIIEIMIERFAIAEIAESICSAGFLPLDPFVGYKEGKNTYILEGNRRLATIQLLLSPELTPKRHQPVWDEFRSRLKPQVKAAMQRIDVLVFADRRQADVLAYIGYRHVNGIMSWDAEEKAAYIAQLIEDPAVRWSYEEVAKRLGSKPTYVEKLYVAHRLVEQSAETGVPGAVEMRRSFGVLTRALQSPGITRFLQIEFPRDPLKSKTPAKTSSRDLQDFVRWTFGTDEVKPVLEDSRDLTRWGQILGSPDAVRYLRNTTDPRFERAFAKSGGLREGLIDSLMAAADRLEEAVPLIRQHRTEEDVERAVERCTDFLVQIITQFPGIQERQGLQLRNVANT